MWLRASNFVVVLEKRQIDFLFSLVHLKIVISIYWEDSSFAAFCSLSRNKLDTFVRSSQTLSWVGLWSPVVAWLFLQRGL